MLTFLFGYYEALLFKGANNPLTYYRYVDDTFAAFNDEDECNEFLSHLNSLHPLFRFTFENKCDRTLPFLDVLVEKNDCQFVTSIYRKSDFTGQYIRWNSFCSMKWKINLISTLVYRALVICSESNLQNKLSNIRSILINNGYTEVVINTAITRKMNQFRRPTQSGPKKCSVYLYLLDTYRLHIHQRCSRDHKQQDQDLIFFEAKSLYFLGPRPCIPRKTTYEQKPRT